MEKLSAILTPFETEKEVSLWEVSCVVSMKLVDFPSSLPYICLQFLFFIRKRYKQKNSHLNRILF